MRDREPEREATRYYQKQRDEKELHGDRKEKKREKEENRWENREIGRDGKAGKERETERGRGPGGKVGERSKGYLHRVVFFRCFLFEPFVERLSRLIFGMMSMNYILYKTWQSTLSLVRMCFRGVPRDAEHRSLNESLALR